MDNSKLAEMNAFWNKTPVNTTRSSKPIGSKEFFDDITWKRYVLEPHIKGFAEFEKWKGKKVLEIGSGIGTDLMEFAKGGAIVTGIDYSTESIELAKKRFAMNNMPVRFVHANAEHLSDSLPVEKFDLIYSFGVLHHTPNPENAYREITKYMTPNSVFKLMVYHRHSLKALAVILRHGPLNWKEKLSYYSEAKEGSPITYTYTVKEICDLLEKCGYKVDKAIVTYLWMRWYLKWIPKPILRWIDRNYGWNICLDLSLK